MAFSRTKRCLQASNQYQKEEVENLWICFPVSHAQFALGPGQVQGESTAQPMMRSMFPEFKAVALSPGPGVISGRARGARRDLGEHLVQPGGRGTC